MRFIIVTGLRQWLEGQGGDWDMCADLIRGAKDCVLSNPFEADEL